ncbi:type 4a pilus biogenesis protein PilO [Candidatus Omnitrophota bacterium]
MATGIDVNITEIIEKNRDVLSIAVPMVVLLVVLILFLSFIFSPSTKKIADLKSQISAKENLLLSAERDLKNLESIKEEIAMLEQKSSEFEQKLPSEIKANLMIETLKEVTEETKLQFVSIEPQKTKRIDLPGSDNVYLELPIKITLKSGYDELIKFLDQIEQSDRLMKITDFSISSNPRELWEHAVELHIGTYASVEKISANE